MARLGVTLGDPAGVGPEVTESALADRRDSDVLLFGPEGLADVMAARLGVGSRVQQPFDGRRGEASAASGSAALAALHAAMEAARAGEIDALVTAPISKEALAMAGCADRGHTWILARELGDGPVAMAFLGERLRVVLASDHVPLVQALATLTPKRVVEVAALLAGVLSRWARIPSPRLALAGLNPHAGENGIMGDEEERILMPAVEQARARGVALSGPLPADALPRPGFDSGEDVGHGGERQRDAGAARTAHLAGPRHSVRAGRYRHAHAGRRHARRHPDGGGIDQRNRMSPSDDNLPELALIDQLDVFVNGAIEGPVRIPRSQPLTGGSISQRWTIRVPYPST